MPERTAIRFVRQLCRPSRLVELNRCIACTPNWFTFLKCYLLRRNAQGPFSFLTRRGSSLCVLDWDELTTLWHVFCRREYEVPDDAKIIVDLGANFGAFSIWAAENYPKAFILAVEPFPETYARLTAHVASNGLNTRVQTANVAIAGHDGQVAFDATDGKRSYCRSIVHNNSIFPTINISCLSLASLLDRHGLRTIDCLKMDVEGGEYTIIANSSQETLRRAKVITLEFHDLRRSHELWSKLVASGFRQVRYSCAGWSGLATYHRVD